ncbi:hypothetical protein PYCCODRAFT_1481975 [Trametes coccinea BRFM310]|uniref:MYND-type domain-containing protein n=1 Tax=Trametes coccinea (strain BRFM310) TaxID=1353009 RepID=A0A1Y2I8Y8_TRAC3|nr:hypothetical protein PYCCODRAFT_1481975 [Trametes coccinea BRFM310]
MSLSDVLEPLIDSGADPAVPVTEPRCGHCLKTEAELPEGVKLKYCSACFVPVYCSPGCQEASWDHHKVLCECSFADPNGYKVDSEASAALVDAATPIAVLEALLHWVRQIQPYALSILGNALVYAEGSVIDAFAAERLLFFGMAARAGQDADNENPGKTFRLTRAVLTDRVALQGIVNHRWDTWMARCRTIAADVAEKTPSSTVIGVIPAICMISTNRRNYYAFHPVHIHRPHDGNAATRMNENPRSLGVLKDIASLCWGSIQAGLVLRCPFNPKQHEPTVGTFIKRKDMWSWKPRKDWKWDGYAAYELHSWLGNRRMASRTNPRQTWSSFYDLLPFIVMPERTSEDQASLQDAARIDLLGEPDFGYIGYAANKVTEESRISTDEDASKSTAGGSSNRSAKDSSESADGNS